MDKPTNALSWGRRPAAFTKLVELTQRLSEGLSGLLKNRSRIVPGRLNRIMNALGPASVKRTFTAKTLGKTLANKPASARAQA